MSLLHKTRVAVRDGYKYHGIKFPLVASKRLFAFLFRQIFGHKTFMLAGKQYRYLIHPFILDNERAVELGLARAFLEGKSGEILEVGNVLSNYFRFPHDIVDKYEKADGVINEDIVSYSLNKKYNWIVSLSTLEHVGWDEEPREPRKVERAIERLKELLTDNGELLVTMPLGYNAHVDLLVREERTGFSQVRFLLRTSANNQWREAQLNEVIGVHYDSPFKCGNAILVGIYKK